MAYRRTPVSRLLNDAAKLTFRRRGYSTGSAAGKRCFLQHRVLNATAAGTRPPELLSFTDGGLLQGNRLRIEGLLFPRPPPPPLSVDDTRRILRLALVQQVITKLREVPENSISYVEFVRICAEEGGGEDQGEEMAKALKELGNIFIVGNIVILRPEQVTKSLHALISQTQPKPKPRGYPRRRQLEEMERQKAEIDSLARAQVRAELFCGLGFLMAQTVFAMRLTFWELSWDVMEPVCFFAASVYFIVAYTFFLRTSTEPTFEGYFRRRFATRQRKLMAARNFDFGKYEELLRAFYGRGWW